MIIKLKLIYFKYTKNNDKIIHRKLDVNTEDSKPYLNNDNTIITKITTINNSKKMPSVDVLMKSVTPTRLLIFSKAVILCHAMFMPPDS